MTIDAPRRSRSSPPAARPPAFALGAYELRTFAAVADAFFPSLDSDAPGDRLSARDLAVTERLPALVALLPHDADRVGLKTILGLLGSRAGGLLLHGRARSFHELSSVEAESALLEMAGSPRLFTRQAFKIVRQLACALLTYAPEGRSASAIWSAMQYPGPLGPPPETPRRLAPITIERAATWTCDVVVVGSGAGGGVAAGVLARAGLDVVVLERGPYQAERDFTHLQQHVDRTLYATRFTSDLGVALISGSCLGGGTVVNYSTSLATPPEVRAEWDREAGFRDVFEGAEYQRSLDAVSERIGVGGAQSRPWVRDQLIERAMLAKGWKCATLTRNVRDCPQDERCGFCNFGCRQGAKQSTTRTWLEDAADAGARFVVGAEAERIVFEAGRAVGVRTSVQRADGSRVPLTVFGRAVVVACGATFTPLLLQQSRLTGAAIGRYLRVHPVTGVWGRFDEHTDPWGGVMQARIGAEFADLDGRGYGFRFESGAIHPVEFSVLQGWGGAVDFKRVLRSYRHWAPFGILLRDRTAGSIRARRGVGPAWDYAMCREDVAHVREGVRRAAEALVSVGAREIRSVQQAPVVWRPACGEPLESFLARVDRVGYGPCQTTYGSYHQMGSARMGASPRTSVVDDENQVHGTPGLYVMDASCFPTASGVNPMLSIEAIAHRAARALAARFATARA